uniref:Phosphatidylethanolamine binding protein 4 n=1 Tax=Oryzias latipes TaxID=8090 RepID=A0A3P9IKG2_ORYLA
MSFSNLFCQCELLGPLCVIYWVIDGLEVIYPELDIDKCLIVSKDHKLREKISRTWKAPYIYFPRAKKGKVYVLVMVDPDAPSRTKPTSTHWRHWLVANIEGRELKKGKIKGKILTEYQPPTPPQKSGFHRYQFMLFEQLPQTPVSLPDEEKRGWKTPNDRFPLPVGQLLTQFYLKFIVFFSFHLSPSLK